MQKLKDNFIKIFENDETRALAMLTDDTRYDIHNQQLKRIVNARTTVAREEKLIIEKKIKG